MNQGHHRPQRTSTSICQVHHRSRPDPPDGALTPPYHPDGSFPFESTIPSYQSRPPHDLSNMGGPSQYHPAPAYSPYPFSQVHIPRAGGGRLLLFQVWGGHSYPHPYYYASGSGQSVVSGGYMVPPSIITHSSATPPRSSTSGSSSIPPVSTPAPAPSAPTPLHQLLLLLHEQNSV